MNITVMGDIHGNLVALEKLIKNEKGETDLFVCHGDVVNYGPWSTECLKLLLDMDNSIVLRGNHEDYFIDGKFSKKGGTKKVHGLVQSFFDFCYSRFDHSLIEDMSKFELEHDIEMATVCHTLEDRYIFADTDLDDMTLTKNHVIGHSHQQYKRPVGDFMLYNTGSLGQNRAKIDLSCYLKVDTHASTVTLKEFTYDVDLVLNQMKSLKYPAECYEYYAKKDRVHS